MPSPVQQILARSRGVRGRTAPSLADLREREADLEALQYASGAPTIPEDQPGIFSKIIDVLSRPNYAVAGFFEEMAGTQPSVERGVKRALTEIFSGVGGIQGEKRAFGETLEKLGVGTKTLADAFPALEGTWIGNFGSRGLAGLALDVALDPLTYMTFGAGSGLRISTSKGLRYLNKSGVDEWGKFYRAALPEAKKAIGVTGDAIADTRVFDRARTMAEEAFEAAHKVGDDIDPSLLEKGGAKLFGAQIPGTAHLGGAVGKAVEMLPESISKPAIEGATQMRDGMARILNGIFSPEGALSSLPQPLRERAARLTASFTRSSTAHRVHLLSQIDPLEDIYRKLEKADAKIGERWYDIREGIRPVSDIKNPDELRAFTATMSLYEQMGKTLVDHGVLSEAQLQKGYIYHTYKNVDDLAQYHPQPTTKVTPGGKARFEKNRVFDSFRAAEQESQHLHNMALRMMSRGEAERLYPVLQPEFDVFKNMRSYINDHSTALARKAWREEMLAQFGKTLDEFDFDEAYKAVEPSALNPEKTPVRHVIEPGDIEPALVKTFGPEGARYVAVKSKLTGDELVYLPKAVADAMGSVSSRLFNTPDYKEFSKLLKGYDWLNNTIKWGLYTIWPASLTRDAYSNLFLGGLRIGFSAIDPKRHADAIRLMAGRELGREFAGSGYTLGQLRELSKTLGVWVPGHVFVEHVGTVRLGKVRQALTDKRGAVENEARVLLWLDEIRRGIDPRSAADTVGQFLFNYGEVSPVERELFRRMIPFYTFTRKNVERQWKMLRHNPGLSLNQVKPFRGYESEDEQMVSYEAEGLKLRLDRDGKTLHALTGIDIPIRNLDTIWAGGVGETGRRLMGMLSPVIKAPIEAITGTDLFTGDKLGRVRSDTAGRAIKHMPKAMQDWFGYSLEYDDAGRPQYTFDAVKLGLFTKSWALSRAVTTSDRVFREYVEDGAIGPAMLDLLTGLRDKEINLDEAQRRKLQRRIKELEQSLVRRGVMREYRRAYQESR